MTHQWIALWNPTWWYLYILFTCVIYDMDNYLIHIHIAIILTNKMSFSYILFHSSAHKQDINITHTPLECWGPAAYIWRSFFLDLKTMLQNNDLQLSMWHGYRHRYSPTSMNTIVSLNSSANRWTLYDS